MGEHTPHSESIDSINYLRAFPWVRLFRAFWIAVDIRKLLLTALALMVISVGDLLFDRLPFAPPAPFAADVQRLREAPAGGVGLHTERWPWQRPLGYSLSQPGGSEPISELQSFFDAPGNTLVRLGTNWQLVLRPLEILLRPAVGLFQPDATWSRLAFSTTRLLWALCVWAIFGGAVGRMSAVQFARDQKLGIRTALNFAGLRFFAYVSAPLLPLAGVAALVALCAVGGLLGRIPVAGEILVGVAWGLGLVFGFLMALVLIGVAAGWPLMFATINVEGTDGFDGLSRAYNYVYERPWHYLWYAIVSMAYGSLVIYFVWLVGQLVVSLTGWAVAWGMGYEATLALFGDAPRMISGAGFASTTVGPADEVSWGAILVGVWLRGVALLVVSFVYSYFWTATTIMYFLLRREVDANDFDEVHLEQEDESDDLLPLVGMAAVPPVPPPQTVQPTPSVGSVIKQAPLANEPGPTHPPGATSVPPPSSQ